VPPLLCVVQLNALNMIVDCSHCNKATTLESAALSTQAVIATHANAENVSYSATRNKADEELQAIAATGGVVGIMTLDRFLSDAASADIDDYLFHVDHVVSLVGPSHVGFSSDGYLDGQMSRYVERGLPLGHHTPLTPQHLPFLFLLIHSVKLALTMQATTSPVSLGGGTWRVAYKQHHTPTRKVSGAGCLFSSSPFGRGYPLLPSPTPSFCFASL
jgi:hypothetical protein